MTDNLSLFQYSLRERTLHELAKACWGEYHSCPIKPFVLGDEEEFLARETAKLVAHRKSVVDAIHTIFPHLPKVIRRHLIDAVVFIQRGYGEALICTNLYRCEIKLMRSFPLSCGPYSAKNFIDPAGWFDEFGWAMRFVRDETQSQCRRFELACLYCFEDEIKKLWDAMSDIAHYFYVRSFHFIENRYGFMVYNWIFHLENGLDSPEEFYSDGFVEAIDRGLECGARFFWKGCAETEKDRLMSEMEEFNMTINSIFSDSSQYLHEGFVYFYYSLLSLEQKRNLISLTAPIAAPFLWSRLLLSRHHESVLKDMQTLSFPTSSWTYAYILRDLTSKMVESPVPDYEEIFKALWKPLSLVEVKNVLGMDLQIIRNLSESHAVDLLEMVIEPLSPVEKEWMLLKDWQHAGISAVNQFLLAGDYDGLHRYLLLLLTYRDRITHKQRVRSDAVVLLDRLVYAYNCFLGKNGSVISECAMNEVNEIIDSIRGSALVLHCLLEQVDHRIYGSGHNSYRRLTIDRLEEFQGRH